MLAMPIVVTVLVVIASLYLSGFLALRTDSVAVSINAESPWSGEITIQGVGKIYAHTISISGNGSAQYFFERPEGVKTWQIMVNVKKDTSELTELEVTIFDSTNSKTLVQQKTSRPNGTLEVFWRG